MVLRNERNKLIGFTNDLTAAICELMINETSNNVYISSFAINGIRFFIYLDYKIIGNIDINDNYIIKSITLLNNHVEWKQNINTLTPFINKEIDL